MKQLLLLLVPFAMSAETLVYNFDGSFPGKLKVEDNDGVTLNQKLYRNLDANSGGWIAKNFGTRGKVALSLSAVSDTEDTEVQAQCNRLISETIKIEKENAQVRWESRSLVRSLPETYRVVVICNGAETELYRCEGENYDWTTHAISLSQFKGKEIQIAIECTSVNKWALALDNWSIGEMEGGIPEAEEEGLSTVAHVKVIDHFTGTWCNNCPAYNVKMEQLKDERGKELFILETHVNDYLTCNEYYQLFNEYVRSIPGRVINRDQDSLTNDEIFNSYLNDEVGDALHVEDVNIASDGDITFSVTSTLDGGFLNVIQVYDYHDDMAAEFVQSNSASNARAEQWYYLPSDIMPRYMTFENVPSACDSITIAGKTEVSVRMKNPTYSSHPRLLVELLPVNQQIANDAVIIDLNKLSSVGEVTKAIETKVVYYDLFGRTIANPTTGIFIQVKNGKATKIKL